jgi:hypothetical protein
MRDRQSLITHISVLLDEIDHLDSMLQPHDTGHIHTAISVLQSRVNSLLKELGVETDG